MILETAILDIRAGETAAFEAAFATAAPILAAAAGYQRHELRTCMEKEGRYLLLVWWDSVESHTVGFRGSQAYQEWKRLLHRFYDPFPTVEHYSVRLEVESFRKRGLPVYRSIDEIDV